MTAELEGEAFRVSRRKVILSSAVATAVAALALVNCGIPAKGAGWTKRIGSFLARLGPKPTVELQFAGPFENQKLLLDKPVESDWVCVEKNIGCQVLDDSPKTKDIFQVYFDFRGEKTKARERHLVSPYKIAFAVFIRDKQGQEHTVVDKIVDYNPQTYEFQVGRGLTMGGGESSYGGVFSLPIKVKDATGIRVRLSKVSS